MSTTELFGPLTTTDAVEDAVIAHLELWAGDYLPAAFDGATDLPVQAVQTWVVAPLAVEEVAQGPLPCVAVLAGDDVQAPEMEPDGTMNRTLGINIVSDWLAAPARYEASRQSEAARGAKRAAFALDLILLQKPRIAPNISVGRYLGIQSAARYTGPAVYRVQTAFEIRVERFAVAHGGPDLPGDQTPVAPLTSYTLNIDKEAA